MIRVTLLVILTMNLFSAFSQALPEYRPELFIHKGDTLPYRILWPDHFDKNKKYPLMLVLHGAGERGKDNELQLVHGSSLFLRQNVRDSFPAIVVFPQCPEEDSWVNIQVHTDGSKRTFTFQTEGKPTASTGLLLKLISSLRSMPYIDKERLYIGGISMGAMGTFDILKRKPEWFAAAFAICGGDNPDNADRYYKKTSLWIFHGEEDDTVDAGYSKAVAERLRALGADVKLTIYPGVKHPSWNNAFADPDLLPWLFSKHK